MYPPIESFVESTATLNVLENAAIRPSLSCLIRLEAMRPRALTPLHATAQLATAYTAALFLLISWLSLLVALSARGEPSH
jgi:hypothetical protein